MNNQEIQDLLTTRMPELTFSEEESEFLNINVSPEKLHELALFIRENEALQFDYLFCLTGVDWGEAIGVVYHLKSTEHGHSIVVRCQTENRQHTELASVTDIWATAEFHEREAYDLFGIHFTGHPDLRRIFLTDDWEGWPMRKDYEDDVNMIEL